MQVPLRNQSTVTFPVGIGFPAPELTVTKSWTVVPAATEVTVACVASWIAVVVVVGTGFTSVAAPEPEMLSAVLQGNPPTGLSHTCL